MSETEYGDRLWWKALRCGNVSSDSRLKALFADGLLPAIRTHVLHHLTTHPRIALTELTRYAEGMGTAYRGGRNYPAAAGGRDRSGHRTDRQQRCVLLSEESSEPCFLEEVDVSSDRPLAMAVETAAFPSPLGTRSTYLTASPGIDGPEGWEQCVADAEHTTSRRRRPVLGAPSAEHERRNSLPPLTFAGETLLSWDVAGGPSSDFGPTGDELPTETYPEELQTWGSDSQRPEGESVTGVQETLPLEDPPGTQFVGPDAPSGGAHEGWSGKDREVA